MAFGQYMLKASVLSGSANLSKGEPTHDLDGGQIKNIT